MIAILEPRCFDGDTRKFAFNVENTKDLDLFESWITDLNDGGYHNYLVYWVTVEEYQRF